MKLDAAAGTAAGQPTVPANAAAPDILAIRLMDSLRVTVSSHTLILPNSFLRLSGNIRPVQKAI